MRASFYTLGCKVNRYETQLMSEELIKSGFEIVDENDLPDVFIINSCTVTAESDRKTRQTVHKYRKKLPHAVIVLTGCMPQAFPDKANCIDSADIVLGNATNYRLSEHIRKFLTDGKRIIDIAPHIKEKVNSEISTFFERTKAFLKIEDGCDRFCTYCIIPYARGRVRSKSIKSIKDEVESLAKKGFKEVVLIGINLSAYGKESGKNLADAVETAASVYEIKRIRLGSMEPDQFTDEIIARLANIKKFCPQFHFSLQSGCDNTLKRMNRHYDTAFYANLVKKIRSSFENCSITTDIMVGFAGETDEDFNSSVKFLTDTGFAKTHVFAYSRRSGTVADGFSGQISNSVKHERSRIMIEAASKSQQNFLQTQLNNVYPVLFENRSKNGYFEGYTPNYTLVFLKTNKDVTGKILNTKLVSIEGDGCIGTLDF